MSTRSRLAALITALTLLSVALIVILNPHHPPRSVDALAADTTPTVPLPLTSALDYPPRADRSRLLLPGRPRATPVRRHLAIVKPAPDVTPAPVRTFTPPPPTPVMASSGPPQPVRSTPAPLQPRSSGGCDSGNWQGTLGSDERYIDSRESGVNPRAVNSNSGARGLGQLTDSTYSGMGMTFSWDPCDEITAQRRYMSSRYGTWGQARAFWDSHQWW